MLYVLLQHGGGAENPAFIHIPIDEEWNVNSTQSDQWNYCLEATTMFSLLGVSVISGKSGMLEYISVY